MAITANSRIPLMCVGQDSNLRRPKSRGLQPRAFDHSATDAVSILCTNRAFCARTDGAYAFGAFAHVEGEFAVFYIYRHGASIQDTAGDHHVGDGGEYFRLDEALERAGAILGVVALFCHMGDSRFGKGERDVLFLHTLRDNIGLHPHDVLDRFRGEDVEEDYLIETVEKFGAEKFFERAHDLIFYLLVALAFGF